MPVPPGSRRPRFVHARVTSGCQSLPRALACLRTPAHTRRPDSHLWAALPHSCRDSFWADPVCFFQGPNDLVRRWGPGLQSADDRKYLLIGSCLAILGQAVTFKLTLHIKPRRSCARLLPHGPLLGPAWLAYLPFPGFLLNPGPPLHETTAEPRDYIQYGLALQHCCRRLVPLHTPTAF